MMSPEKKLYIAGTGMITAVGGNTALTTTSVKAGISGYATSSYYDLNDEPVTMALIPNSVLDTIEAEIIEGNRYNERHDRVTKMAIIAIREACRSTLGDHTIPLLLAMPEVEENIKGLTPLIDNFESNCKPWVSSKQCRHVYSGRAAGMEAIDFAFRYLSKDNSDYVLIGGSDSYQDYKRVTPLSKNDRLLVESNRDGFAPGEAACFLLLTHRVELAQVRNGHVIALNLPGIAEERGHLGSQEPYRGEGLDAAFKKANLNYEQPNITSIYSSLNGENHWSKELGVAVIRNKAAFIDNIRTEHPADVLGDVGSASSTTLLALAAENLLSKTEAKAHLVYSSSDTSKRGAILVEKLPSQLINP